MTETPTINFPFDRRSEKVQNELSGVLLQLFRILRIAAKNLERFRGFRACGLSL
jgi:hypothetical protein